MSMLFFRTLAASNPSFPTRTASTALSYPRSYTRLIAGIVSDDFYIGKTKRRLQDRKTEHFKALTKNDHSSTIADHIKTTGQNIKWDNFDILASEKTDYHCKIKGTLLII